MSFESKWGYAAALALVTTSACTLNVKDPGPDGDSGGESPASDGSGGSQSSTGGTSTTTAGNGGAAPSANGGGGSSNALDGGAASGGVASSGGASQDGGGQSESDGGGGSNADTCGATEKVPNDTRDTATPFTLGATVRACLQAYNDADFYEFTMPDSPAQGGVVAFSVTNVDASGSIEVAVQTAADNGTLTGPVGYHGDGGQSVWFWLAGAAKTKFRIDVHSYVGSNETGYTLGMTYTGVADMNEPNDTRETATEIGVGKAVTGYFFSGFESATQKLPWDDWFKVTLPEGSARFALSGLADDLKGAVEIVDSTGAHVTSGQSSTNGADATVTTTVHAADYYVHVTPGDDYSLMAFGQTLPSYATKPYTLTVTPE